MNGAPNRPGGRMIVDVGSRLPAPPVPPQQGSLEATERSATPRRPNIRAKPLHPLLFADTALIVAQDLGAEGKNKSTQVRKFYDELERWHALIGIRGPEAQQKFDDNLVFVMMMKARVAYAVGRKLVTQQFADFLADLLTQVYDERTPEALYHAKLFFEAYLAYAKQVEKSKDRD